jgi:hypothetical protein
MLPDEEAHVPVDPAARHICARRLGHAQACFRNTRTDEADRDEIGGWRSIQQAKVQHKFRQSTRYAVTTMP